MKVKAGKKHAVFYTWEYSAAHKMNRPFLKVKDDTFVYQNKK